MPVVAELEQLPVQAARQGDPDAWHALFRRYQLPLYAYVFELVRDEQVSLDLVQETFISAARHLVGLRDDDRFGSWLFGIAHQKCIQRWRRRGLEQSFEPLDDHLATLPAESDTADECLIREEQREHFFAALERLPVPQRAVLVLHFLEDFPLAEIARITDVPVGTVKSRLHFAKKTLRALLEETEP